MSHQQALRGCGLGLRAPHFAAILSQWPNIPWFEVLADNYLLAGGPMRDALFAISERYPLSQHSVGMSLGSTDPLNWAYLKSLRDLAQQINPVVISDHLCFVSSGGHYFHDLLPLPYTAEAVSTVVERVQQIQDYLGRRIAIENVSSYLCYKHSEMSEGEFIAAIANNADCDILLDINNAYVNSINHHFDLAEFLQQLPRMRIVQYHLGGHADRGDYLLDTHGSAISDSVWKWYHHACDLFGPRPTLIEWDNDIPDFHQLVAEAAKCGLSAAVL